MKKALHQFSLFLKRSNFDRGIRLGTGIAVPIVVLYFFGHFEYAPPIMVGVLLSAPSDIPGSIKRKINATLINIALTMLVTAIILFAKPFLFLLLLAVTFVSFFISLVSVYGFRASLVSFSGLMAMVLSFAVEKETFTEIMVHVLLIGVGGLLYLLVSIIFQKLAPKRDQNQLLSDTLLLISAYLELRAKLLSKKSKRETLLKQSFILQNQINEKQEVLREVLITNRKRSGRSHYEEKELLIFISSVNIFELIEAKHIDYDRIDRIFGEKKEFLEASKEWNNIMGYHLKRLSEILIQNGKIPNKKRLLAAQTKANDTIGDYVNTVGLPQAREGALVLRNLADYQSQLLQEIRGIRRVMTNVKDVSQVSLKRQDSSQFLTLQEYRLNVLIQSLSLGSKMFRHALRFTIAIVFAFLLGYFFNIENTYWILLTIVVIMRPSYGLTKERSKDRIIGTIIGAVIAFSIVLITQNVVLYSILAYVSFIVAFSLIQQNYKSAAALLTISIVFVYSLIHPNSFEVIQFRVIDTAIGAAIAVIANYFLFPSWEADNLKAVLLNAFKMNKQYLEATEAFYENKTKNKLLYNVARKEAFLAVSNLNAAFQRLTQDPKSKQKEYELIYEIVTLNQTMISAIASIGNFINFHQTTPVSKEFAVLVKKISNTLQLAIDRLEDTHLEEKIANETVADAQAILLGKYQELSNLRDDNIKKGNTTIDNNTLHGLQEAYLISNHMNWLISLSENLKKATVSYQNTLLPEK
ncbi:hypothetical protein DNU06_02010 [Putridiphycobacter roseus]|uniref:Uncharacterized protein n=1 Tax=Putridiphycobacter roseus TaxID=2219161 RepID=A0A2W1NV23_9FLAO|nr:FUSC family membrane protein [Putridiphycobacter roseus]PZE18628.1 hypothetical protein DNU06_02010 [Putridiphycobacter roseus]